MATRRERVVLQLDDQFSTGMAKAATSTALLHQALEKLDGTSVRITAHTREVEDGMQGAARGTDVLGASVKRNDASINQLTGRIRVLAEVAAILAPAGVAIGAVAVPAITGLAQQMGFAALAGGTMLAAFQGVGDALEAVNKAALEPTAANLEAARLAMEDLSPAAQDFVTRLRETVPALKQLRDTAAEGMFPGLTEGIDGIEQALPRVTRVVEAISGAIGDIAGDAGQSLGGERWAEFIDYLGTDGPEALADMAAAVGNVTHAMAALWMAFDPLNDDFSGWMVRATADLDRWAQGLARTEGFADFVDYIRTNGPRVADALGAVGSALVDITTATAPLSGPVLSGIEAVANVISAIADSDLGTPIMAGVAGLALLNRTLAVTASLSAKTGATGVLGGFLGDRGPNVRGAFSAVRSDIADIGAVMATAGARTERETARMSRSWASLRTNIGSLAKEGGRAAGPLAAIGVLSTGAADGIGLTNTASLALAGAWAGAPGAAIGAGAGFLLDLKASAEQSGKALEFVNRAARSNDMAMLAEGVRVARREVERFQDKATATPVKGLYSSDSADAAVAAGNRRELEKRRAALAEVTAAQQTANRIAGRIDGYERQAAAIRESRAAASSAAGAFLAFGDALNDPKKSLGDFIQQRRDQAEALINVADNVRTAFGRGLNGKAIQELVDAGPEGALRLQQLADGTDKAINQMNAAQRRGARGSRDLRAALDVINAPFTASVSVDGAEAARDKAQAANKALAQVGGQRPRPRITAQDNATRIITSVRGLLFALDGDVATTYVNTIRTETRRILGGLPFTNDALGSVHMPVRGYAMGDVANHHQPELAGPGPARIWREPETQGEAYVPLANDYRRPRARRVLADAAEILGGAAYFADGGLDRRRPGKSKSGAQPTVTIVFPDPIVSESAAEAAERIAAAAQLTVRSVREQRTADLDILQARQRIDQIAKSLTERETKVVKGKDGKDDDKRKKGMQDRTKKVSYLALRGIDREVAMAELSEAKLALTDLRNRRTETDAILDKIREEREAALEKRRDEAENAIAALFESRTSMRDSLYGSLNLFGRGSARGGAAAAAKAVTEIRSFGQIVARLRDARASSALLLQVIAQGKQGNFKAAIKFGESLLAEPALINDLNTSLGQLDAVSSNVSTLVTDPRITGIAPGAATVQQSSIAVDVRALDISQVSGEIARIVTHQVDAAIAQLSVR